MYKIFHTLAKKELKFTPPPKKKKKKNLNLNLWPEKGDFFGLNIYFFDFWNPPFPLKKKILATPMNEKTTCTEVEVKRTGQLACKTFL